MMSIGTILVNNNVPERDCLIINLQSCSYLISPRPFEKGRGDLKNKAKKKDVRPNYSIPLPQKPQECLCLSFSILP